MIKKTIIIFLILTFNLYAAEMKHFTTIISKDIKLTEIDADKLAEKIAEMLGLSMHDFKGTVKVLKKEEIARLYKDLFDIKTDINSFYMLTTHTIYINVENYNEPILAHEITHALITSYFAEPIPIQIQEILCKSMEYITRKGLLNQDSKK